MKPVKNIQLCMVATCIFSSASIAQVSVEQGENSSLQQQTKAQIDISVQCTDRPNALRRALNKIYNAKNVTFTISGECYGPIQINQDGISIVNDAGMSGSLRVRPNNADAESAILIKSSSAKLDNFNIDVPNDVVAVTAKANATVEINHITTNAKAHSKTPFYQFIVTDNSTAYLSNQSGNSVGVYNSSYTSFVEDCDQNTVEVYDTSAGYSKSENHFNSVQVAGNGYFLADDESHISTLKIWSKGAAEINNESTVGELQMGGQSLFAAYKNSAISGPYFLWGNVVFELEHSKAYNWKAVTKPNSIIAGNNATVNGEFYPNWSWTGQDKKLP
ncbi:hypothetical protein N474_17360 [Pseudoalteromonas luteoviolacea CPMOR-2]|uniref:hypothetical protein n=1 Tax=Pseudoalteromonas luteoviolacea TaxID=43657 RepID=UPI0007B03D17|nr:hypothetical protein [Pseudoalteromonas luteoviolacea]KZN54800.1 hypothetical protein N474_17360 [Pseudoalteromonas luteoviolacea CPMOR-2]